MESKIVEFEDGQKVQVRKTDDGFVATKLTKSEQFWMALEEAGYEVEGTNGTSTFVGNGSDSRGGTEVINRRDDGDIMDIADDVGVEIVSLWPAFQPGDSTDLDLYVSIAD
jgi:hypothetical protein